MKSKPLSCFTLFILAVLIYSCTPDFDWNGGVGGGPGGYKHYQPRVPLEQIEGVYEGSITYWINEQEYLEELSKESGYITSIIMTNPGEYIIIFDSTFLYLVPELNFKITETPQRNTIILDIGQAYNHWHPTVNDEYAGLFGIDTKDDNTIWYSMSIKSTDQDSLRMLTIYGIREIL